MKHEGPQLESLLHRLTECPPEFLMTQKVSGAGPGETNLSAIIQDHFIAMGRPLSEVAFSQFRRDAPAFTQNHLKLIALMVWLLHDEWFLKKPELIPHMWSMLSTRLRPLSLVVQAADAVKDADRREELTRTMLAWLSLRPRGETEAQARDRLNTLDSDERQRVLRQTRDAEMRARLIREKMAADAAKAAAARYSPE